MLLQDSRLVSFVPTLFILFLCLQGSATDENPNGQGYLPNPVGLASGYDRLQQIMKGVGPGEISWPQRPNQDLINVKNVKTELAKLNTTYVYQSNWPAADIKLGSVTAVSFDKDGNVVIFHRVDRVWNQHTFDVNNRFQETYKRPIKKSTVLGLDRSSGRLLYDWGRNMFYMPHGLTIDQEDNVWLTDVALHQVFKFGPRGGDNKPRLTLGTALEPGTGKNKFCKPTSVAVLDNGDFFVADGYCNARILKYSKAGELVLSWGQNSFAGLSYDVAPHNFFAIPHALTLVPEKQLLCAADRENGRVQCFYSNNGTFHSQYHNQLIGDRLFSMAYTPANGGEFVIVNGPTAGFGMPPDHYNEVHGFIMNMRTKQVLSKFGPNNLQFENPHDVAVTVEGNEIYVAELDPMRIHKFLHKSLAKPLSLSAAIINSTTTTASNNSLVLADRNIADNITDDQSAKVAHSRPSGTAILVATLMLLFAFLTFALSLLVARRRKRGCMPFGTQNRRHAWDKPEGFKLGGLLLDRSTRSGFEKLDQDASDEERDAPTNLLNSAQFA